MVARRFIVVTTSRRAAQPRATGQGQGQGPREHRLPLRRVRLDGGQVGRPVRRVPGLGHRRGGRRRHRPGVTTRPAGDHRRPPDRPRSTPSRRPPGRPAWPSSTGCSAAGWCRGAVVLLAGEPGVGKSTLLLDVAAGPPAHGTHRAVRHRRGVGRARCGCAPSASARCATRLLLAAETDLAAVLGHVDAVKPDLLVVDSVQTIASDAGRRRARRRHPGARGRGGADPGRQGARHGHRAGRPRHQGRRDRRAAGAGAPGRRRAASSRATGTPRCGWCAAVKNRFGADRRGGLLRAARRRASSGLADPSGLFLTRHARAGRRAPASRSPWRAAGRWSPRCRRWSRRRR